MPASIKIFHKLFIKNIWNSILPELHFLVAVFSLVPIVAVVVLVLVFVFVFVLVVVVAVVVAVVSFANFRCCFENTEQNLIIIKSNANSYGNFGMHRLVVVANYTHISLSSPGALGGAVGVGAGTGGASGGAAAAAAAALLIGINLVLILWLKGGQLDGDPRATGAAA